MIWPILYKRSVKNKISTWRVEAKNGKYRTISGFLDGKKIKSAWTTCYPKNLGKKNSTTAKQQAKLEAQAMFNKQKALGYFENLKDVGIQNFYKPMLAHDYDKYKNEIKFPLFSQPKLDGVRCIVKFDGMWSRNGKPIISAPHIFKALEPLFEVNPHLILDGELYADKDVADFNTIISYVRKTKPTLDDLKLSAQCIEYHVYDLPSNNNIFSIRNQALNKLNLPKCCKIVETTTVCNEQEIKNNYEKYIAQGYEGQMLRTNSLYENKRSKSLLKHKSFIDDDFIIIGAIEGKGNLANKLGKLQFQMPNGKRFDAAINGTWEYLEKLWQEQDLIGKTATVKYFELTEDGVPRFPKVVEIRNYE